METKELYYLAKWYKKNVIDINLEGNLSKLCEDIFKVLGTNYSMDTKQTNIRNYSKNYRTVLSKVDITPLSYDDIQILERLGLKYIFLGSATSNLDRILERGDTQEVSSIMSDSLQTLKFTNIQFTHFLESFEAIFGSLPTQDSLDTNGKVLTRLRFHNDALISNMVNLSDWTSKWNTIARGYSMALGQAPEEFEVVSASKGSIIFDLLLDFETVKLFSETFNLLAETTLNLAELAAVIKGVEVLKSSSPDLYNKAVKHLEDELAKKNEEMAEQVADKLLERLEQDGKVRDGEVKTNLKKSVKELDHFVSKGGDIHFRTESDDIDTTEQIQLVNEALKQLQHRSKQKKLEDKS